MKSILITLVFIFLFVHAAIPSEWYEGGTLHRASCQKWMNASYKNRLATSADWFVSITKSNNPSLQKKMDRLSPSDYLKAMKAFAKQLEKCVSDTVPSWGPNHSVAEVASTCYLTMYGVKN